MIDFAREARIALKTGKVILGSRQVVNHVSNGKGKLVVLARNTPEPVQAQIEGLAKLSGIPVFKFEGSGWELGTVCEKPYIIVALDIIDPGESEILQIVEGT